MAKIDKSILKDTLFIATWTIIFSCIMQAVFLIIKKWTYPVILGNILGAGTGILNFFLLGLTVQKALTKDAPHAKQFMKLSQMLRMLLVIGLTIMGVVLRDYFNLITLLVSLFFPRIAIFIYSFLNKKKNAQAVNLLKDEHLNDGSEECPIEETDSDLTIDEAQNDTQEADSFEESDGTEAVENEK